ncbi:MAG: CCA tRNA nucleotidyltransferase [Deltaproteobacteria bacterium]|nr:CCA tRNA nucleotidyltransferase [Deltaproteobacteria bacterium]
MTLDLPFDTAMLPRLSGVYLVGGSVRDLLLGRHCIDYDIAVSENPAEFARRLSQRIRGNRVTLGKSDQVLFRVARPEITFDITPLKGPTIESDLAQRDFTINAMAWDLETKTFIDPFSGKADLEAKQLKALSASVFEKDPVRLIRAFRICAALGLKMDADTAAWIQKKSGCIQDAPPERIAAEIIRILRTPGTAETIARMARLEVLFHVLPELEKTRYCTQNRHHAFDVFQHTLKALERLEHLEKDLERVFPETATYIRAVFDEKQSIGLLKWAMLLHDIGKPKVKSMGPNGTIRFHAHEKAGAQMAEAICRRLRFSNANTEKTVFLVRNHIKPLHLYLACRNLSAPKRIRTRFFLRCGSRTPELLLHTVADILGKRNTPDPRNEAFIAFARELFREYFEDYQKMETAPPYLTGIDLMAQFALEPSPAMKTVLNRIREAQLSGEVRDKTAAFDLAREILFRIKATYGKKPPGG